VIVVRSSQLRRQVLCSILEHRVHPPVARFTSWAADRIFFLLEIPLLDKDSSHQLTLPLVVPNRQQQTLLWRCDLVVE